MASVQLLLSSGTVGDMDGVVVGSSSSVAVGADVGFATLELLLEVFLWLDGGGRASDGGSCMLLGDEREEGEGEQ